MKYVLKRLFGEEFNNLLLLNLLTVGLCIPVVTAGPAILAMKGTLVKILDDRCDLRRIHEFWGLFKKKFWKGLLFEVLFILYGMMLLWCKSLADNVGGSAGRPLLYAAALGGLLACIVSVCAVTILASVQMPFSQAMWNALCLAIGRLPRSLASAVCVFGLAYATFLLYPYSLLFVVVILPVTMSVLSLTFLWDPLDELVFENCTDEQESGDEKKQDENL